MAHQFKRHYTRDEARALLPEIRAWLDTLLELSQELESLDRKLSQALGLGDDLGGSMVNQWARALAQCRTILQQFKTRDIMIKDIERGLIDFPAFIGGREVFLCWEKGEDDIEFWHDVDTGYSGRERL